MLCGALYLAIGSCTIRTRAPLPPAGTARAPPHIGRTFDVVPSESLLTVLVYRAGALASAGHNHVIASHGLSGAIEVTDDTARTSCLLRVPVDSLAVDEPELRAQQSDPAEFPPDVPQAAREGTYRNMVSEALLDAAHYHEITVSCLKLAPADTGHASAELEIDVRGRASKATVPVEYASSGTDLTVQGEASLKQSELGLTPFTALLGALQVQDEMKIRFHIVARAAETH